MIIQKHPNPSGAYPAPQSWNSNVPPSGYVIIDLGMTEFYSYNGFVTLTIEGDTVTAYTPNVEAWEAWKAEQPEPTPPAPTTEERVTVLEEATTVLEEATTALEDAICEMDAMNAERMAAIEDALCEIDMG